MPHTQTHNALRNYDILVEVFKHLLPPVSDLFQDEGKINKQTLASSARVCRRFSEPALNVLWEKPDSLMNLFHVLITESSIIRPNRGSSKYKYLAIRYIITGAFSWKVWARFQEYARRIRVVSNVGLTGIDSTLYRHLARRNNGMPLLPLLDSLDWYHIASFPKDSLLSVISPSLRRVCIEFDGLHTQWTHELRHHDVTLLIRELCSKAPALQIVRITGSVRLPSLLPVASLPQLRQLEVLDSRNQFPIDVILPVFCSMSTLPSLVKLDIPIGAITEALRVTGFHMLESLNTSGSVSDVTHFILGITSPYFRSIQIHVKPADLEKQRNFFAALSLKFATSLRSVFAAFLHGEPGTEPPFLLEIIGPLLAVGGLQRISLDFGALNVSIPDDEIFRMAETWPDLTKLQLECGSTERRPSVHALSALARCCPQLSELVLPSLDDSPLLSEAAPDYIFVGHKLRRLQIGARHLGLPQFVNPRWLAIFIDQSFPFLNVSRCLREHHWPFRLVQHWVGVLRQIKNLRVGRRAVGLRNYETECTKEW